MHAAMAGNAELLMRWRTVTKVNAGEKQNGQTAIMFAAGKTASCYSNTYEASRCT